MKQFLILFREPDGRGDTHTPEEIRQHRQDWQLWSDKLIANTRLTGGNPLTLNGRVIKDPRPPTWMRPQLSCNPVPSSI